MKKIVLAVTILGVLMAAWRSQTTLARPGPETGSSTARQQQPEAPQGPIGLAPQTVTLEDYEIVRNGDFNLDLTGWSDEADFAVLDGFGTIFVDHDAGADDGPALVLSPDQPDSVPSDCGCSFSVHRLDLPDSVISATLSLDYGLATLDDTWSFDYFEAYLYTVNMTGTAELLLHPLQLTNSSAVDSNWHDFQYDLTNSDINDIMSARANGQLVLLAVEISGEDVYALVDNVSLKVDGEDNFPTDLTGDLAYVQYQSDLSGHLGIVVYDWETDHAYMPVEVGTIGDLAWRPDGSEVAFTSLFEMRRSAFHSNAYAVSTYGVPNGFRRITFPPSPFEVGDQYELGTVTGVVENNTGYSLTSLDVYMRGATDSYSCPDPNNCTFTLDVADLGPGVDQPIVFTYAYFTGDVDVSCNLGKEYDQAFDIVAGGTVDAGTLSLDDFCIYLGAENVSWKPDGETLAFSQEGGDPSTPTPSFAQAIDPAGALFGTQLISETHPFDLDWSPDGDEIVYSRHGLFDDSDDGLYVTQPYHGPGVRQVTTQSGRAFDLDRLAMPVWNPDGSGYAFNYQYGLYYYEPLSDTLQLLATFYNEAPRHPTFSPDGRWLAFEVVRESTDPEGHSLWMLDMENSARIWRLGESELLANPHWSSSEPPPPPSPPQVSPENNATTGATPTLEWSPVPGATEYELEVDTDADGLAPQFHDPVLSVTTADTSYTFTETLTDGVYYWRVRAGQGDKWGEWGEARSFTVDSSLPSHFIYNPIILGQP